MRLNLPKAGNLSDLNRDKRRDDRVAEATLPIRTVTRLGAQVAPQQSLVFRAGDFLTTIER
ncbi:MAG: hypothetical protein L0Z53_26785 [Acidobacteriales bacterium]|nr:hypothetical protein [Terriglobales bacterium]